LYIRVAKHDRKILKGAHLISRTMLDSYFNENTAIDDAKNELDIYLMSNSQLIPTLSEGSNERNSKKIRAAFSTRREQRRNEKSNETMIRAVRQKAKRFQPNARNQSTSSHCVCEKLRKTSRRINTKYLLLANVLKTRHLGLNEAAAGTAVKLKARRDRENLDENETAYGHNNRSSLLARNRGAQQGRRFMSHRAMNEQGRAAGKQIKLIYLNGIFNWNRSRAFIDYLENETIDKSEMCKNVRKSVNRIFKSKQMLF
jgi:hypothetical protein